MKKHTYKTTVLTLLFFLGLSTINPPVVAADDSELDGLLPNIPKWKQTEAPQTFLPETLFEYINGAAEIYLSYEFKQLIVAQYQEGNSEKTLAIEIYDMGEITNSFGIYSAERYPDNRFIPMGLQGYLEEGSLNFLIGQYYVKLLCFDCEENSTEILKSFAEEISGLVGDKGHFPKFLSAFPQEGLVPNTEKFILKNVMGYSFLHDGYLVNYKVDDLEFDGFIIVGKDEDQAKAMLKSYIDAKKAQDVKKTSQGFRIKDKYYHNIYIAQKGPYLCGVIKINDGYEKVGESYLTTIIQNLKN